MITLFCLIFSDSDPFPVKTSPETTVEELKELILADNPNSFQGTDARKLTLWQSEIQDSDEAVRNFNFNKGTKMRSTRIPPRRQSIS